MKLTATGIAILGIMCLASAFFWSSTGSVIFMQMTVVTLVILIAGVFIGVKGRMTMGL